MSAAILARDASAQRPEDVCRAVLPEPTKRIGYPETVSYKNRPASKALDEVEARVQQARLGIQNYYYLRESSVMDAQGAVTRDFCVHQGVRKSCEPEGFLQSRPKDRFVLVFEVFDGLGPNVARAPDSLSSFYEVLPRRHQCIVRLPLEFDFRYDVRPHIMVYQFKNGVGSDTFVPRDRSTVTASLLRQLKLLP